MRFHDLRHTAVSLLLALGVPPHVVREIVGHSDVKVTMTVYAHGNLDEKAAALSQLSTAVTDGLLSPVAVSEGQEDRSDRRSRPRPVAEAGGFEPPVLSDARFQGGCIRPLCHASAREGNGTAQHSAR